MNKILEDNEWRPNKFDERWQYGKEIGYEYIPFWNRETIKYTVNDELLMKMETYNKLYNKVRNVLTSDYEPNGIIKIYVLYDPKSRFRYLGYTTKSVLYSLKMAIHKYLLGERSALDDFGRKSLVGLKIKLIYVLKGEPDKRLLKYLKEELDENIDLLV